MAWILLIAAWICGASAADNLSVAHPLPIGWFKAVLTCVLLLGAVVLFALGKD